MKTIKDILEHKLRSLINKIYPHEDNIKHHLLEDTKKFNLKRDINQIIKKVNYNKSNGFHYIKLSTLSDRLKRLLTSFHLQSRIINNANTFHSKFTSLLSFNRNSQRKVKTIRKPTHVFNLKKDHHS